MSDLLYFFGKNITYLMFVLRGQTEGKFYYGKMNRRKFIGATVAGTVV
ncbi:MAG: hypothetical protein ACYS6K_18020 [Planctomycetota bacterium]